MWPLRGSNPHDPYGPEDFKSAGSTIPPLSHIFNELIFVVLGGFEPCTHLPTFTVGVLPFELQDFLLFGGYCKSSSLNHSGLPWTAIVDFKTQDICHYFIKSLQDLSHPGYILDNDDSFRVVSCLYKLFGSWLQIGRIQIRTGTTTPLTNLFL